MRGSDETTRARLVSLEREARERPRLHKLRLLALALIGYLYPLLWFGLSFGLVIVLLALAPVVVTEAGLQAMIGFCILLFAAIAITAAILLTFGVTLPTPVGLALKPGEAAPLRALIDEVQQAAGGVSVDHVLLDIHLNAGVVQILRFGLAGPRSNYLIIGLPLLSALRPDEMRAVLAHEFGHLRAEHGRFSAWIYRVHKTWEALATPLSGSHRLRWMIMGWFVERYGPYFATRTLALRRLHEYDADRISAEVVGEYATAEALLAIEWIGYRLRRSFWSEVFWEAAREPLPPADIQARIVEFLSASPPEDMLNRWRLREQSSRTPITEVHPCLADRLEALGCRSMLDDYRHSGIESTSSCLPLLGDCLPRVKAVVNATWKAAVMEGWRHEYDSARLACEASETTSRPTAAESGSDDEWEELQREIRQALPGQAASRLGEFVSRRSDHATAQFILGRLLLDQDDPRAIEHLEAAMRSDSDYIAPGLQMMLEYHRQIGRDDEADTIRMRLQQHTRNLTAARKERLTFSRRDRFEPHDLAIEQVTVIRRILYRYPRIQTAWVVRKRVRHLTDKPSYVLALASSLRDIDGRANKILVDSLSAQIPFACAVIILTLGRTRLRKRILQVCPTPVFQASEMTKLGGY